MSITSYYNVCEIHPPKTLALCEETPSTVSRFAPKSWPFSRNESLLVIHSLLLWSNEHISFYTFVDYMFSSELNKLRRLGESFNFLSSLKFSLILPSLILAIIFSIEFWTALFQSQCTNKLYNHSWLHYNLLSFNYCSLEYCFLVYRFSHVSLFSIL